MIQKTDSLVSQVEVGLMKNSENEVEVRCGNLMKRLKRFFLVLSVFLLVFPLTVVLVTANSTQRYWDGADTVGTILQNSNSPIVVEKELLTFDIQQFPDIYSRELEQFLEYSGKVTAEYTLYNPSDYSVTATLLFPFGCLPSYAPADCYGRDVKNYGILVNGAAVDRTLRHTLYDGFSKFDLEKDLGLLDDDYMTNPFYSPEMPVTQYVFIPSDVDTETYKAADVAFDIEQEDPLRRIYFVGQNGYSCLEDGTVRIGKTVQKENPLTVYVIGQDYSEFPQWKFYNGMSFDASNEIEGTVQLVSREEMTFLDFALMEWAADTGVTKVDWYNALVTMLTSPPNDAGSDLHLWNDLDLSNSLMRWYEYEMLLGPSARIVNSVTAPMYPSITEQYEPSVYSYTYLLSPAKTWAEFGSLDIAINTPFYLTGSSLDGFEKKASGYTLHMDGLPDGELMFDLCTDQQPVKSSYYWFSPRNFIHIGIFLIVAGSVFVVLHRAKTRNRGQNVFERSF